MSTHGPALLLLCGAGMAALAMLTANGPARAASDADDAVTFDAGAAGDTPDASGESDATAIDAPASAAATASTAPEPSPAPAAAPAPPPPPPPATNPLASEPAVAHADDVAIDARSQELELRGNVELDEPPFYLRSEHLRVKRSALGLELDGDGRLIFCPCLGAPLSVAFTGGTVAPPGDVILRSPRLLVFGVPVFWLPYAWLRSAGRPGLLAPELALRGTDGLFAGGGVHLPWKKDDTANGLDLRAGGYFKGGAAVDARLTTPVGTTRVVWDHLDNDGLTVDARGAAEGNRGAATVAWDVDAIRGARGVRATTDIEAAARPVDRARASASWRLFGGDGAGNGGSDWTASTRVRGASPRGGPLDALALGGPDVAIRGAGAITNGLVYDALVDGGAWSGALLPTTSFLRGDAGLFAATQVAPFGVELRARGAGDAADDGDRGALSRSASARAAIGLPLSRSFGGSEGDAYDSLVHRTEPRLAVSALTTGGDPVLGAYNGRGFAAAAHGSSWVASAEWANAVGRWGARQGAELVVASGAVGTSDGPRVAMRARGSLDLRVAAASVDFAALPAMSDQRAGDAMSISTRLGALSGFHVGGRIDGRDGLDPVAARALFDAPLEPGTGYVANVGWTAAANATIPWTAHVATTGGADFDLASSEVVGARGALELKDGCGCLVVRALGAHRIGRPGVDVGVTVDFAPR